MTALLDGDAIILCQRGVNVNQRRTGFLNSEPGRAGPAYDANDGLRNTDRADTARLGVPFRSVTPRGRLPGLSQAFQPDTSGVRLESLTYDGFP